MSLIGRLLGAPQALATSARSLLVRAPSAKIYRPIGGRVLPDLSLWQQFQRVGGGLTPQQVSSIIRQADSGDMRPLMDLANEARQKDCHLQGVLGTRETAVAGLKWDLVFPGQDPKSSRGKRQVKMVRAHLEDPSLDFRRTIAHLAGAFYPGYAVTEIVWEKRDGELVPAEFVNHAPRRFGFNLETGAFIWRDLTTPYGGVDFRAEFPQKFIVSQPRINGDVPCREGLVRVLMWAALFRNWTIADWLKLGEIAWKPWRTGQYKKGASDTDKDALVEILERMSASGVAVYPETVDVKVEWPAGQVSAKASHGELFDVVGKEMSKAVLGQTLTTEAGKIGSQALGKVHDNIRKDLLEGDAMHISAVITRDLVAPDVRLNMGPTAPIPLFILATGDDCDLLEFAKGVAELAKVGARVGQTWVRTSAGIPEPKDGEDVLTGVPVLAPAPPVDPNAEPPPADEPTPTEEPKKAA